MKIMDPKNGQMVEIDTSETVIDISQLYRGHKTVTYATLGSASFDKLTGKATSSWGNPAGIENRVDPEGTTYEV
jgi:hypothetical protein